MLIYLNGPTWLLATILDSAKLEDKRFPEKTKEKDMSKEKFED